MFFGSLELPPEAIPSARQAFGQLIQVHLPFDHTPGGDPPVRIMQPLTGRKADVRGVIAVIQGYPEGRSAHGLESAP